MSSVAEDLALSDRASPGVFRRLARIWDVLLFVAGLILLAFVGGMVIAHYRVFPYHLVRQADEVVRDWKVNWRHYLQIRSRYASKSELVDGATVHDQAAIAPGLTFVTGYRSGTFHPFLLDQDGKVVHAWDFPFSKAWPDSPHLHRTPADWEMAIHGASLLPDGGVVMNFDGAGMVKIDRCSRLVWSVPLETHHAIDVAPNGEILAPGRHQLKQVGPGLPGVRVAEDGFVWDDTVVRLAPDGTILDQTPMLELLLANGRAAELYANTRSNPDLPNTDDPLHLNDVEVLREDMAAAFPQFAAGDLLVSMRNINAIAVLDGKTLAVKWWRTGPFIRQHDPDFLPNGHIMVFDNRMGGERRRFGQSRVLEIDPKDPVTTELVWSFTGSEEVPFYTDHRGKLQVLPNGNILVAESLAGRVFEIAREGGDIKLVWQWVNGLGDGLIGYVTQADRIPPDHLGFVGQPCS